PQRALWLPAGMMHEVSCRGAVSLRTLYIDPVHDTAPHACRVLEVSEFLKALVLEAVKFPAEYDLDGREGRIVWLLLDEIRRMPGAPYHVPMPAEPRLSRVCQAIIANPADQRDIDAWSSQIGMSRRTFTRAFKHELGMGFALWRQQVRLMQAVSLLAAGRSITSVAFDVGYESPECLHRDVPPRLRRTAERVTWGAERRTRVAAARWAASAAVFGRQVVRALHLDQPRGGAFERAGQPLADVQRMR